MTIPVCVEAGKKRVFASALDWPGWCRSGKSVPEALAALEAYEPRYRLVATAAAEALPKTLAFEVVESLPGNATTEFGAPGIVASSELQPLTPAAGRRLAALLRATWQVLDGVGAHAPAELRKGPRGGGRDTPAVLEHVYGAEDVYLRQVGIRLKDWAARREALLTLLESGADPAGKWPLGYCVRRTAWHALDHAWEIEDRSQ